jgi:GT2 family glycosyltransferase
LVDKIGFPEKNFFIFADDTEYFIRAKKADYDMFIVKSAKMDRLLPAPNLENDFTWKHYYIIRNIIACDVMHSNLITRTLRPLFYTLKWLNRANTKEDRKTVWKALKDSYFYKSGN